MIRITDQLSIPQDELTFTASRSSGPGGQHVNKVSTRITLRFDVTNSPSLTPSQKRSILDKLPTRVSKEGILRVVSQQTRSQAANRETAIERFVELLQYALKKDSVRRKTAIPPSAKQKRIDDKKHRSRLKQERSRKVLLDG
ncbi:MAG: alternative ribosome rescue aminoacyl-tRNA hydrolase ArfB [Syntrophobacterales bacterium]|jgi:ribosome-associated protein